VTSLNSVTDKIFKTAAGCFRFYLIYTYRQAFEILCQLNEFITKIWKKDESPCAFGRQGEQSDIP
jgi:hypothetical protein